MGYVVEETDVARYPPLARALVLDHLGVISRLPAVFAALLLREVIGYDWRFPAERQRIDRELAFLGGQSQAELAATLAGFAAVPLSPSLQRERPALAPAEFIERLTAHLWAVHAMDQFREVARFYGESLLRAAPEPEPAVPRLCVVVIGKGAPPSATALFAKLRPQGTYFNRVSPDGGFKDLQATVQRRLEEHPAPYAHWYVDGGAAEGKAGLHTVSYEALEPLRSALLKKVGTVRDAGDGVGPESLRTLLASLQPEQLNAAGADPIQRRFELSLLTEGSGTQIFSTTFVQWAGRELLRRARPLTLVLRYAPRQAERSMNQMLRADSPGAGNDAVGSLIDADMGAYYTWLNLMRLPGAEQARFVVWFEDGQEALVAVPAMARGVVAPGACDLGQILRWIV